MAAKKKGKAKGKKSKFAEGPKIHTEATAKLLAFANPPSGSEAEPEPVARECVAAGLSTIGINGPFQNSQLIDFGAIDRDSCIDFANAIELCVDQRGFEIPAISGTFVIAHEEGVTITFGNLVRTITDLMKPK